MAKSGAQAPAEKPEAQKGSVTKMPIFLTKFDGSGSDNTDEFRRTLIGHIELRLYGCSLWFSFVKVGALECNRRPHRRHAREHGFSMRVRRQDLDY